jgi:hypothetical protein
VLLYPWQRGDEEKGLAGMRQPDVDWTPLLFGRRESAEAKCLEGATSWGVEPKQDRVRWLREGPVGEGAAGKTFCRGATCTRP